MTAASPIPVFPDHVPPELCWDHSLREFAHERSRHFLRARYVSGKARILRHLARDQRLQQRLRANLAILPQAVDEFARAYSVVSTLRRIAKDVTFHGVKMLKADLVLMPLFLAGRDPRTWKTPHDIDLDRRPVSLAFASGPHVCVGRYLALREIRIALESLLTRFDQIYIRPGETYVFHTSPVYGIDRLPLAWAGAT